MRMLVVTTVGSMLREFLVPFAQHFRSQGWQVDAMARPDGAFEQCVEHFDHLWPASWTRNPLDVRSFRENVGQVRRIVASEGYDIVHVHTPIAAFITRYALRRMRVSGKPEVIYTAHGFHFHNGGRPLENGLYLAFEKLAGHWTDYLIVINREDEASALRYRIVPPERLRYMPGIGLDLRHYDITNVSDMDIMRVRAELGIRGTESLLLMIAEFTRRKRHEDALLAFSLLGRLDVHLALAGEGPELDRMQRLTDDLGISGRVHFLGFRRDIPALIRASAATLLVSAREGLPRSTMESLYLGTPVIGTDIRGIRDLLADNCGRLVPVGDPTAIAEAMAWILDHAHEAQEMGIRGHLRMGDYALQRIIRLHEELYSEAVNEATGFPISHSPREVHSLD
jgi:glycosyltransferase involved in cell wall biosynthesis